MPQRVHRGELADARRPHRHMEMPPESFGTETGPPEYARARVNSHAQGGKSPKPGPFLAGIGILAVKRVRELDPGHIALPVAVENPAHLAQMAFPVRAQRCGQHRLPVFVPLAGTPAGETGQSNTGRISLFHWPQSAC